MALAPANITLTRNSRSCASRGATPRAPTRCARWRNAWGCPSSAATELGASNLADSGDPGTLNELAASFPQRVAGRDTPVQVVALLPMSLVGETSLLARFFARSASRPMPSVKNSRALSQRASKSSRRTEIPLELANAEQQALRSFDDGETAVARMNDALGTDAVFVARLRGSGDADKRPGALHVEVRMLAGSDLMHVRRFGNQTWIADGSGATPSGIRRDRCLLDAAGARGAAADPRLGRTAGRIQYASLGKGFFSIKLSRRPQRAGVGETRKRGNHGYLRKMRLAGRYERSMVGRETQSAGCPRVATT